MTGPRLRIPFRTKSRTPERAKTVAAVVAALEANAEEGGGLSRREFRNLVRHQAHSAEHGVWAAIRHAARRRGGR